MTDDTRQRWSVVVTLPDSNDRPVEVTDPIRRIGPYYWRHDADTAVFRLNLLLPGSAPAGTTLAVEPYDGSLPHLDGHPPAGAIDLAEAIRTQPDGNGGWGFPDLYARLHASLGAESARTKWASACAMLAADEEAAEQERRAQAAEEERLAPHRAEIDWAAKRRAAVFTEPVLLRAAKMLADMVDTAERHGVSRHDLRDVANLSGACLDAVAGVVSREARHVTPERARELIVRVRDSLRRTYEAATIPSNDPYSVNLGSRPALRGALGPLVIQLDPRAGWNLIFARPGMVPSVLIDAGITDADAEAVADAVDRVHRGEAGDPFDGRR